MHTDRIEFISAYCDRWCEPATTADADAAAIAQRLQALRVDVERAFRDAGRFVRPGFDQ